MKRYFILLNVFVMMFVLVISLCINSTASAQGKDVPNGKGFQALQDQIDNIELTPGPKGDKGDPGEAGADGVDGTNGIDGTNGVDGADGGDLFDHPWTQFGTDVFYEGGKVGIGTTDPKQTLAVNGSNNINLSFPDGLFGLTPITMKNLNTASYTVPIGKNLYIIQVNYMTNILHIDGIRASENNSKQIFVPIIAGAGQTLSSQINDDLSINGFLVDAHVTPITMKNLLSTSYTVPTGKNLFICGVGNPGRSLLIDSIEIRPININAPLELPIIAGAGQIVSSSFDTTAINGYLRDQ